MWDEDLLKRPQCRYGAETRERATRVSRFLPKTLLAVLVLLVASEDRLLWLHIGFSERSTLGYVDHRPIAHE